MSGLQVSWLHPTEELFWWGEGVPSRSGHTRERRALVDPTQPKRTQAVIGWRGSVRDALVELVASSGDSAPSDTVRVWGRLVLFAADLVQRRQVRPRVLDGRARWAASLNRGADRQALEALSAALPAAALAAPISTQPLRVPSRESAALAFVDAVIDALMRSGAYPGTARGWPLVFADALREGDGRITLRDARQFAIPRRLGAWSPPSRRGALVVGFRLGLPEGARARFALEPVVHLPDRPRPALPVAEAWTAGAMLLLDGQRVPHPAEQALRGLARAARVVPELAPILDGPTPKSLHLDAEAAWRFLATHRPRLEHAGFSVLLPEAFDAEGAQRLRARLRVLAPEGGRFGVGLPTRWEVLLGDRLLKGAEFAALVKLGQPIVRHADTWVLLDPEALARLPADLDQASPLSPAEALSAALTGTWRGVEVVVDASLSSLLDLARVPPALPPPPGLHAELRPYQARGYAWLHALTSLGLGAALADDMGLGKTLQVLTWMLRRVEDARAPILVVCPTSLLGNWEREAARFTPSLRFVRHHGQGRELEGLRPGEIVLTTYGLLVRDAELLTATRFDAVVLDEAQAIKNPDSQRSRVARDLQADARIAMTGTPVENRLDELWAIFDFLQPGLLGPRATFAREVAVPVERLGDEEAAARLRRLVAPFLLRRLKSDPTVIDDLPDKIERSVYASLSREQAALYEQAAEEDLAQIEGSSGAHRRGAILAMLTRLKQICNHPAQALGEPGPIDARSGKLERCGELLTQIFDLGERALIFTQYRVMGDLLQRWLKERFELEVPFLHGGVPTDAREAMVRRFQTAPDAPPVMLISLKAGGTGLNLTRATHVIHYDRWWNPAVEDQATDRAHRIGQKERVVVHKLISEDTLEERVDRLLQSKRQLVDQVVGAGETWIGELDDAALRDLVVRAAGSR
jgi:superfamily II DNA or RNA helicase